VSDIALQLTGRLSDRPGTSIATCILADIQSDFDCALRRHVAHESGESALDSNLGLPGSSQVSDRFGRNFDLLIRLPI
jgi:hypothetical protein